MIKIISLFLVFLAMAHSVVALPRPMDDKELLESSDFAGEVKVIGVVQTRNDTDTYKGQKVASYNAWLQITKTVKGHLDPLDTVIACWHEIPEQLIGAWYVGFSLGEQAIVYLKWQESKNCYTAVSWNAKISISPKQKTQP